MRHKWIKKIVGEYPNFIVWCRCEHCQAQMNKTREMYFTAGGQFVGNRAPECKPQEER